MCELISFAVSSEPFGSAKCHTQCKTHGWSMESYFTQLPDQPKLCPIGRIEKAVEDGLAKIEATIRG
jgi:hypothetical protein